MFITYFAIAKMAELELILHEFKAVTIEFIRRPYRLIELILIFMYNMNLLREIQDSFYSPLFWLKDKLFRQCYTMRYLSILNNLYEKAY